MKDETKGVPVAEFARLKSYINKMYSYIKGNNERDKKSKKN